MVALELVFDDGFQANFESKIQLLLEGSHTKYLHALIHANQSGLDRVPQSLCFAPFPSDRVTAYYKFSSSRVVLILSC